MRVIFINTWSSGLIKCHILRFWTSSAAQYHITHQLCNDLFCSLHVNHKLSHTKSIRTSFTTVCLSFLSWDSLVRHIVTKRALIYIGLLENPCLYHYCITSYFFLHDHSGQWGRSPKRRKLVNSSENVQGIPGCWEKSQGNAKQIEKYYSESPVIQLTLRCNDHLKFDQS